MGRDFKEAAPVGEGEAMGASVRARFGDGFLVADEKGLLCWGEGVVPGVKLDAQLLIGRAVADIFEELAGLCANRLRLLEQLAEARHRREPCSGSSHELVGGELLVVDYEPGTSETGALRDIWRLRAVDAPQTADAVASALIAASSEWRATFDAIPALVVRLDATGVIRRINRTGRQLADKSYTELIGRNVGDAGDDEPWQIIATLLGEASRLGVAREPEARSSAGDRTWDVHVSQVDDSYLVFARDITQEVRMRRSLRASETMSAMGELVAGVAHEVRNPLFSISATLDAFDARFGTRREESRHISLLRAEVARLTRFMQDLLDYGRPPAQRLAPGSLNEIVERAIEQCAEAASAADVRVVARLGELPELQMDAVQITQVVRNLLENAIQHSPKAGTVVCRTEHADGDEPMVRCIVTDSGSGFRPDDLTRVFDPFFTRRRGGTGLGLAIVQRVMLAHGGEAAAANRDGNGAELVIALPAARATP